MKKKLITTLGTLMVPVIPLVAVLSCGNKESEKSKDNSQNKQQTDKQISVAEEEKSNEEFILSKGESGGQKKEFEVKKEEEKDKDDKIEVDVKKEEEKDKPKKPKVDEEKKEEAQQQIPSFGILPFLQTKGLKDVTPAEIEKILGLLDMASIDLPLEKDQIITIFNNLFQGGGIKGVLEDEALQNQLIELATNALVKGDDTSEGYSERKEKVATFIQKLLFEGLGGTKQEAQTLILDFVKALEIDVNEQLDIPGFNIEITYENIINAVLSYVYNEGLEELQFEENILVAVLSELNLDVFKPVFKEGLLNLEQENFKKLILFIKDLKNINIFNLPIYNFLPKSFQTFLDRFQNIDEEQLSSVVNKLLNSGIAKFDTVEDYSQVISFVQILLPFFTEEDSSINKMLKVLQENVYIIKDIIDHGFQTTENATESEKLYLVTQVAGDVQFMDQPIETFLPMLFGYNSKQVQEEDIANIKSFIETNKELIEQTDQLSSSYSELSELTELSVENINQLITIRKLLISQKEAQVKKDSPKEEDILVKEIVQQEESVNLGILPFLQTKGLKDVTPKEIEKILGLLDMASIDLPLEKDQIITIFNNLFQDGGIKGALEDESLQAKFIELATNAIVKKENVIEKFEKEDGSNTYRLKIKENAKMYFKSDTLNAREIWETLQDSSLLSEEEINILKGSFNFGIASFKNKKGDILYKKVRFIIKDNPKDNFILENKGKPDIKIEIFEKIEKFEIRKQYASTFINKLLNEGLGQNKEDAKELISNFLKALKMNLDEKVVDIIGVITITYENIIDALLANVYDDDEEWFKKIRDSISSVENIDLDVLKPIFKEGLLNLEKESFKKAILFIKDLERSKIKIDAGEEVDGATGIGWLDSAIEWGASTIAKTAGVDEQNLYDHLPDNFKTFIDSFQNIDEEQLSSIFDKLLNSGIAEFDTVEDYQKVISFVQILLPFFTEEDSSVNKMLKVLQENVYIIKDIIDHGFQTTENATESEKLYLVTQVAGDVQFMDQPIETFLPMLFGYNSKQVQEEDIANIKSFIEKNKELVDQVDEFKSLYSQLNEETKLQNEQVQTFISIRKFVNSPEKVQKDIIKDSKKENTPKVSPKEETPETTSKKK